MGNNSIRVNLSKDDIISEIYLLKSADLTNRTVFLVVEGTDDIAFINNRLSNNIEVFESFSGFKGVREIVEHFSDNAVIGICDRDYDVAYSNSRVFFYDYNCLEMMMVSNNEVFTSVCNPCYSGENNIEELRFHILNDLLLISLLRKIDFDEKIGINFKQMSINNLINNSTQKIDVSKIKSEIKHDIMFLKRNKIARLKRQVITYEDLLNITNGHDFIAYLQKIFDINKPKKTKTLSSSTIMTLLIASFRQTEFTLTALYSTLKNYEATIGVSLLM